MPTCCSGTVGGWHQCSSRLQIDPSGDRYGIAQDGTPKPSPKPQTNSKDDAR